MTHRVLDRVCSIDRVEMAAKVLNSSSTEVTRVLSGPLSTAIAAAAQVLPGRHQTQLQKHEKRQSEALRKAPNKKRQLIAARQSAMIAAAVAASTLSQGRCGSVAEDSNRRGSVARFARPFAVR